MRIRSWGIVGMVGFLLIATIDVRPAPGDHFILLPKDTTAAPRYSLLSARVFAPSTARPAIGTSFVVNPIAGIAAAGA